MVLDHIVKQGTEHLAKTCGCRIRNALRKRNGYTEYKASHNRNRSREERAYHVKEYQRAEALSYSCARFGKRCYNQHENEHGSNCLKRSYEYLAEYAYKSIAG